MDEDTRLFTYTHESLPTLLNDSKGLELSTKKSSEEAMAMDETEHGLKRQQSIATSGGTDFN